jgi:hypothetical protein
MIINTPASEPGTLLLLGAAMLAVSLILRRLVKGVAQVLKPTPKVAVQAPESAVK